MAALPENIVSVEYLDSLLSQIGITVPGKVTARVNDDFNWRYAHQIAKFTLNESVPNWGDLMLVFDANIIYKGHPEASGSASQWGYSGKIGLQISNLYDSNSIQVQPLTIFNPNNISDTRMVITVNNAATFTEIILWGIDEAGNDSPFRSWIISNPIIMDGLGNDTHDWIIETYRPEKIENASQLPSTSLHYMDLNTLLLDTYASAGGFIRI